MTTGNTSLLGLALPVEGELDGTWGDVVNDSITSLVDSAVAGTTTLSVDADVTLTDTALAANQARQAIIRWTASNGATTRNITAPARSKAYIVINAGTGSVVIRGAGPTTGVTVAAGDRALVAWSGSDFVRVGASAGGSNTQVQFNNGGNLAGSANLTFDGTTLTAAQVSSGQVNVTAQGDVRFEDAAGGQYVALQAPVTVASNVTFTLPSADGSSGQALVTNGAGVLSFAAAGVSQARVTAIAMVFGF